MVMTTNSSNMVIDLSGDNDNISTTTGQGLQILPSNAIPDATFERSCDNPECSAPKLISFVPKREVSEFITEPTVIPQPTLINGFTTVFQIDGSATRMEDLMKEVTAAEASGMGQSYKPKTVFRVVPNTHSHIVNYVVVDAAGETLRKIKANDPETMRKLLFSQRLSAEQMLKKLIGSGMEVPNRQGQPTKPPMSLEMAPAVPVSVVANVKPPAPVRPVVAAQVCPPVVTPVATPVAIRTSKEKLPVLPSGITLKKLVSSPEVAKPSTSAAAIANTPVTKVVPKPFASITPKDTTTTPKQLKPVTSPVAGSSLLKPVARQTTIGSHGFNATKPVVWQAFTPAVATTAPNVKSVSVEVKSPSQSSVSVVAGNAPKSTPPPTKAASPQAIIQPLTKTVKPVFILPKKVVPSNEVASPTTTTNEMDTEDLDIEEAISSAAIATRQGLGTFQQEKQQHKRKQDFNTPPLTIKRLRPRSPNRKINLTPLAGSNVQKATDSPPVPRKLPTLASKLLTKPSPTLQKPKVPQVTPPITPPIAPQNKAQTTQKKIILVSKAQSDEEMKADEVITPDSMPTLDLTSNNEGEPTPIKEDVEQDLPAEPDTTNVRRRSKPLMGPASRMKALKANAEAKTSALKIDMANRRKSTFANESGPMKIGETIITRTRARESQKAPEIITKPCSVTVTDIIKVKSNTDSDSDHSKSPRSSSRTNLRSSSDKGTLTKTTVGKEPAKKVDSLISKLRTRWARKEDDANSVKSDSSTRSTRTKANATESVQKTADTIESPSDEVEDSTLLTTPSAPTRVLRVVLPSPKIVNNPPGSPHPNLKISSVTSGGATFTGTSDTEDVAASTASTNNESSSGLDIEQMQKELEDLKRTVARLTQGKTT